MTRQLKVLGAGLDKGRVFVSVEHPDKGGPAVRYYVDPVQALTLIRTLAAALEHAQKEAP
jgi:hypothetical protein